MNGNELITEKDLENLKNLTNKIFAFKMSDSVKPVLDLAHHLGQAYEKAMTIRQDYPNGIY